MIGVAIAHRHLFLRHLNNNNTAQHDEDDDDIIGFGQTENEDDDDCYIRFDRTECVRFLLFCRCCVHIACSENNSDMLQPKLTASWEKLISDLTPLHKTLATNFTES